MNGTEIGGTGNRRSGRNIPCRDLLCQGCRPAAHEYWLPSSTVRRSTALGAGYWHPCETNPAALAALSTMVADTEPSVPSRSAPASLSAGIWHPEGVVDFARRPKPGRQRCDRGRRGDSDQATGVERVSKRTNTRSRRRQSGTCRAGAQWVDTLPDAVFPPNTGFSPIAAAWIEDVGIAVLRQPNHHRSFRLSSASLICCGSARRSPEDVPPDRGQSAPDHQIIRPLLLDRLANHRAPSAPSSTNPGRVWALTF